MAQKKGSVNEGEMSVLFDLGPERTIHQQMYGQVCARLKALHPTRDRDLMIGDSTQMQSVCFNAH